MKITIENTTKVVELNGVPARLWEGYTDSGIPMHAYITRIGVAGGLDTSEFVRELKECRPPSAEIAELPLRLIL